MVCHLGARKSRLIRSSASYQGNSSSQLSIAFYRYIKKLRLWLMPSTIHLSYLEAVSYCPDANPHCISISAFLGTSIGSFRRWSSRKSGKLRPAKPNIKLRNRSKIRLCLMRSAIHISLLEAISCCAETNFIVHDWHLASALCGMLQTVELKKLPAAKPSKQPYVKPRYASKWRLCQMLSTIDISLLETLSYCSETTFIVH